MANIYIALNGDDVGSRIGEAIANDDHEGLASASSAIEGAHGNIDQWIESVGGKKITRSGDEGIYIIPEESLSDLESVKGSYKEQSGHGLTVGVGSSMSEASKALIYGKLNGKDQVVHYEPMIEDYLSDHEGESEVPQIEDSSAPDESVESAQDQESDEGESDEQDSGNAQMAAKKPAAPSMEADGNPDEADGDDDKEDSEQASEQSEDEGFAPAAEDSDEDAEQAAPGDDQGDDNQKASESPEDASVPMVPDESEEASEEDKEKDPDADGSQAIDGDLDGEDFGADKDGSDAEAQSAEAGDAAAAQSAAQPPHAQGEGQSTYQELNQDDVSNPDMNLDSDPNAGEQPDDALSSMIHGDMEGDEESADGQAPVEDQQPMDQEPMDEENPMAAKGQEEEGGSQLDEELRQDIASALMAFKENKDMLEQAREQNPKLYQATITMLRSMIEMAKKLGQNPAQDIQDQENEQQLNEEFPAAEEGGEEGQEAAPEEEEQEDQPPGPPKAGGMPAEKK